MLEKRTYPIVHTDEFDERKVVGTIVEYRLFGMLIYRKTLLTPEYYNVGNGHDFQIRI